MSGRREAAVLAIGERILSRRCDHPLRIGVDGVSAAGKTTLADELAAALRSQGREVIRATADDFHNPPAIRHRLRRESPEGYYRDAIDHASLRERLLLPLGPEGSRLYRASSTGTIEGDGDTTCENRLASEDAIVIIDGVFLFRPELNDCWDFRVFIDVDQAIAMERGIERDGERMGGAEAARRLYEARYVPGERLYLAAVKPWEQADAVLGNDAPEAPVVRLARDEP